MNYSWASATHVGHVRERNEDSVHPPGDGHGPGPQIIAVADGMGGAAAGDVASRIAITTAMGEDGDANTRVERSNHAVLSEVEKNRALSGMGTTLTLGIFHPDGQLEIAHVGDSRAYLYREERLEQLTTDHTLVAEMVARGQITPAQAEHHPRRNFLTRVVGMRGIEVETLRRDLQSGDRVLFCSDGLTTMISDHSIAATLAEKQEVAEAAWTLVEAANRAGGFDNTTVVVIDVER